jgi:hypothetical protein
MAERARIISAYVDHFAARGVEGVFEADRTEYDRLYAKYGNIDERLEKIWEQNAHGYCSELNIPWIRPFSSSKFIFIEMNLLNALKTQLYEPGKKTKREWLRKKLSDCIDTVVAVSSKVLGRLDDEDAAIANDRQIHREHEKMLERHRREQAECAQKMAENEKTLKVLRKEMTTLRKACREQLSDLGPALFDLSEARFNQYVSH